MARAGYCSTCQENAYLGPDGGCPKGHGPECVSNVYEVPDAPSPAPAPAAYAAQPAYAPATPATPPKKRRTGLIITLVIVALLLLCGCGVGIFGLVMSSTGSKSGEATKPKVDPEKPKTEAAWALVKGMFVGDEELIKSIVPTDTLSLVPPLFWTSLAANKAEGAKVLSESWNGAVLSVKVETTKGPGTMKFTPSGDTVKAAIASAGEDPETVTVRVVEKGGKWKVIAMESPGGTIPFDAEGLLTMLNSP
jgi:hypothetical protein